MELLIDKKYLVRLERYTKFGYGGSYDPFAVRYVFSLSKNAGLPDGYTVYIDAQRVKWEQDEKGQTPFNAKPLYTKELENDRTYRLDRDNNVEYVAKMTENREEGKRYKQFKFTSEELYALYQNVDLASADLAVAKIDIYLDGREGNQHKVLYGNRIERTDYYVGKVQGSWFYCSELDTKRRIGSHGVKILGNIKTEDEATAWQLIRKTQKKIEHCKETFSEVFDAKHNIDKALWDVWYFCEKRKVHTENSKVLEYVRNVQSAAKSAMEFIDKRLSEEDTEILKIQTELEEQLKEIYVEDKGSAKSEAKQSNMENTNKEGIDQEVIDRIQKSKKGAEFDKLMAGENIAKDHNQSDQRLLNILAFFTDSNQEQMARIFRSSGLYRPDKGDSYLQRSITTACSGLKTRCGQGGTVNSSKGSNKNK